MKKIFSKSFLELILCDFLLGMSFILFPEKTPFLSKITASGALLLIHFLYLSIEKKSSADTPLTTLLYIIVLLLAAISIGAAVFIS